MKAEPKAEPSPVVATAVKVAPKVVTTAVKVEPKPKPKPLMAVVTAHMKAIKPEPSGEKGPVCQRILMVSKSSQSGIVAVPLDV